MRRFLFSAAILLFSTNFIFAGTWTTIDNPYTSTTYIFGIDSGNLIGDNTLNGFRYNGSNWTLLNVPGAARTATYSIDGNRYGGSYSNSSNVKHGFYYNGTNFITLDVPGGSNTAIMDMEGGNLVGYYNDNDNNYHGFIYNGKWTALDYPGATSTYVQGICGNNIVGRYYSNHRTHGFVYNGTTWTTIDVPGAEGITYVTDIDGPNIIGYYYISPQVARGFLYNGINWTTFEKNDAVVTFPHGIEGNTIVGWYRDYSDDIHGFKYEIPEPASAILLILGAGLIKYRRK